MRRGSDWRRFATAYLLSILIHAIALVFVVLFVVHAIGDTSTPDAAVAPDTLIAVIPPSTAPEPQPTVAPTARPTARPLPRPPAPRVVAAPAVVPRRVAPPKHAAKPLPPRPRELAHIVPHAPAQAPPPVPTAPPATAPPLRIASAPTAAPTRPPTPEPTRPPTPEPTRRATAEPVPAATARPTAAPTRRPATPAPAVASARPSARPTAPATPGLAALPAPRGSAGPAGAPHSGSAPAGGHRAAAGSASPKPAATAGGTTARAPAASSAVALAPLAGATPELPGSSSLNDKLKAALPTAPVQTIKHYDLNNDTADRVLDAYEASLAPPLEILLKTFGLIYTTRTATHADSIAYVYERTKVLGVEVCRAYTIVEHPLRAPGPNADHIGPVAAPALPGPLRDVKPEISNDVVPCNAKGMIRVTPGSMTSPAPRHPDLAAPSPSPAP